MKTSSKFNKVINDAGKLALTEGRTAPISSPTVVRCDPLSFKGEIMSCKNEGSYEGKFKSHDTSNSNARRFIMSFNQILKLWEVVSWNRSQRHGMEVVMFRSFFEEEAEKNIISKTL